MDPWMFTNTAGSSLSVGSPSLHLNWGSKTLKTIAFVLNTKSFILLPKQHNIYPSL